MIEERSLNEILADVEVARTKHAKLDWSPNEIVTDMKVVAEALIQNIDKYTNKGMAAPAKRIRTLSKAMETLGKAFRVQSVKYKKEWLKPII